MNVVVWLRSLGLGKYEAAFRENEIDETILPNLTTEDLKDLGVSIVGHRRKLLDAIAALRTDTVKTPSSDAAAPPSTTSLSPEDRAERRQVTVMFSDLVGSTALSARMDPEDLREVISAYQNCVAETVQRFGGFVAKYMGDGVLVYFGYPQAHEDDAERAVRAGLELVAAVGQLKTHAPLKTRIGIATGLVVVGDLIGSGASKEQAIVGETPNLAARLQGIAEPNSVIIAESTRKLVGNLFELEDLGARDLKGIAGPVRAWAALRPSTVESRFEAMHASGLTELVGREEELELLLRRWTKAKDGEGQVVLISGEAGIGKSRLTAAFMERLASEPHIRLRSFSSPQHTDSAFYPIISQMERAAAISRDDSLQAKLDKLDAMLAQSSTSPQDAAVLAEMLSLPNDGRYPALELTPQQRRQRTLEALVSQIIALSRQNPLLVIFEDAHWTDPTTLELFGRVVDRMPTVRALLIVTFRPEFEPPWIGRPYVTTLTINQLTQRDVSAMIDGVVGNKVLPQSLRHDIIERTDGIPLFVEEMTKAVLEAESESAAEHIVAAVPSKALAVPASLHASLMARLDRLGPAKEAAQIGSVIGREFSQALLLAVMSKSEPELQSLLGRLITAGLLFRQGVPPHASYVFKHALVQDAAYGSLLREARRALHTRIAETLADKFPDIAENQPELLAHHFTEAGLIERSAGLWRKAGLRSLERSAADEAAAQLIRARDQISTLPATPALRREEIEVQVALITALRMSKGHAAPEPKAAAERARLLIETAVAVGEPPDDPLLLFSVLFGFFVECTTAFNADASRETASQVLELAKKQSASFPLVIGHGFWGSSLLLRGELTEGRKHLDQSLAFYEPIKHRPLATRFGEDQKVAHLCWRSIALWALGFPKQGIADADNAIKEAEEIGHAGTSLFALNFTSLAHIECGNYALIKAQSAKAMALADEKKASFWRAYGALNHGFILALTGEAYDAVHIISSGIAAWQSTGATMFLPTWLTRLAAGYAALSELNDAWRSIGEAKRIVETSGERWFEAEVYRVAGELALLSSECDIAKPETYFERALVVARQQQAKSWELRAAMSLARLWRDQGKVQQARELLAPVYGWFTEGFDTRDLKEAKRLLEELTA